MLLQKVPQSRENVCATYVKSLMPHAMSRLYVDNYFPPSSKKKVSFNLIFQVYKISVDEQERIFTNSI